MTHRASRRLVAPVLMAGALLATAFPTAVGAAGGTFYVDGKNGSDSNDGRSAGDAFKTIAKAAAELPAGSGAAGWTVTVKGYTDYVYRERPIPPGWDRRGTSTSAQVTFQALGYQPGSSASYVKPIVSGADVIPADRWASVSGRPGVYRASWGVTPFDFGKHKGSIKTALFQNTTTWLWEQTSLDALEGRAAAGKGGYWYDTTNDLMYASAVGASKDPGNYKVEVINRASFYFMGTEGVKFVAVRGFDVRHSANGIALAKGVDGSTVADNVVTGNLLMGIQTSGAAPSDTAYGNTVARNRGSYNTFQLIKVDEGSKDSTYCDNVGWNNGMQGIKVTGAPGGTGFTGDTTGITICRNTMYGHDYNPTGTAYLNSPGILITNGAKNVTVDSNRLYGNAVGIHISQESSGRKVMDGINLKRNQIHDNDRFGINFYDGAYGSSIGKGKMRSDYDVIWSNGTGIMVSGGTSNKTIAHATVHDNDADGIRVGESGKAKATVTISTSLVTNNGGYGMWLVTGNSAAVSYSGFHGNGSGSIKGSPSKTAVNTQPPSYLSTVATNSQYLKIRTSSYQYTAGPDDTAIGARY